MAGRFNVIFTGLQNDITADDFVAKFCNKFGISEAKARQISNATSEVVIKKNLDEAKANQFLVALENCGMIARLDEIDAEPTTAPAPAPPAPEKGQESDDLSLVPIEDETQVDNSISQAQPDKVVCPRCGSDQIKDDECRACGIYISKYLARQGNSPVVYVSESTNDNDNPYATPEADLDRSIVSKDGQGSLEGGINGDYDFSIGDIFSESWERVKGAKGTLLLALMFYTIIAIVINAALSMVLPDPQPLIEQQRFSEGMVWSIIPGLISIPLLYPLMAGVILLGIHRSVDADISAGSIFNHYNKVIHITILTILSGFLITLGMMLLIIPGIYLAFAYMMALALMIDKDLGVWEAMEASRKAVSRHWFKIFFIYLLLWILIVVAAVLALVGLIWVIPLAIIMHGVMYKYMFGVDSVE